MDPAVSIVAFLVCNRLGDVGIKIHFFERIGISGAVGIRERAAAVHARRAQQVTITIVTNERFGCYRELKLHPKTNVHCAITRNHRENGGISERARLGQFVLSIRRETRTEERLVLATYEHPPLEGMRRSHLFTTTKFTLLLLPKTACFENLRKRSPLIILDHGHGRLLKATLS